MKRIVSVFLALLLVVLMAGCFPFLPTNNQPSEPDDTDPEPQVEEPATTLPAAAGLAAGLGDFAGYVAAAGNTIDVGNSVVQDFFASMIDVQIQITGTAEEYISDDKSSVRLIAGGKRVYCGLADDVVVELGKEVTLSGLLLDASSPMTETSAAFSLWRCEVAQSNLNDSYSGSAGDLKGTMEQLAAYFAAGNGITGEFEQINAFFEAIAAAKIVVTGVVTETETDSAFNAVYIAIEDREGYFFLEDDVTVSVGDKVRVTGELLSISMFESDSRTAYSLTDCTVESL